MTPDDPQPREPILDYQTPTAKEPEHMGYLVLASLAALGVGAFWLFSVFIMASFGPPVLALILIGIPLAAMALLVAMQKRFATIALLIATITVLTFLLTWGICAIASSTH